MAQINPVDHAGQRLCHSRHIQRDLRVHAEALCFRHRHILLKPAVHVHAQGKQMLAVLFLSKPVSGI